MTAHDPQPTAGGDVVAFDLEATGLSAKSDRIIEIGAVRLDSELRTVGRFETLVDPGAPVPLAIQRLTGIDEAELRGSPAPEEAMAQFADFCDGAHLVAHGASFDLAFCASLLPAAFAGRAAYDTLELARILLPTATGHSLPQLSAQLEIPHLRPHRAGSDAETTAGLFRQLAGLAEELPAPVLAEIRRVVTGLPAGLARFFLEVVKGTGETEPIGGPSAPAGPLPATIMAGPPAGPLAQSAASLLGPLGPLGGDATFEPRAGQVEMARAVAQTLERSGRLLVEAGTGTGKSLAYLVPLSLWSQRSGRRAVVATHTITLQEQLAERDLPALTARLGLTTTHAMLKGRHHYLSLRRWQRFLAGSDRGPQGIDLDGIRFKLKLLVWLSQTESGDRAELRMAGNEEALWRRVQSETGDCLGAACANWRDARCFMVAARRAAADADIVVTNHALLLADAERQGQVLAPYTALVVDEAHQLETAATRQLGSSLRAADVLAVLDRLSGEGSDEPGELDLALARCREAVVRVFGEVKGYLGDVVGEEHPGNVTVGLHPERRTEARFTQLERAAHSAVRTMRQTGESLLAARGSQPLQNSLLPQPDRVDDELALAAATLDDCAAVVEHVLRAPREGYVAWLELRAEQSELHEAPVVVADQLREHVFDRVEAAVLTSATLRVGETFDFVRERTGIGGGAEELALPSDFDFLSQALCVLPADMPPYDEPGYDAALADLCADVAIRLGGRTLVLFTGYSPLRRAHALLGSRLETEGIAVLGQGLDGTRRQLLSSFLASPRTLLLGTSSFWEGIDVPGDALSCVIIAKLPFPVPTDPLIQARSAALADPFRELVLPLAALRLRQGFGRLIRHGTDRGAVVLCDSRLTVREYGAALLESLPRAAVAREPYRELAPVVAEFVRRGVVPEGAAPVLAATSASWDGEEPA